MRKHFPAVESGLSNPVLSFETFAALHNGEYCYHAQRKIVFEHNGAVHVDQKGLHALARVRVCVWAWKGVKLMRVLNAYKDRNPRRGTYEDT